MDTGGRSEADQHLPQSIRLTRRLKMNLIVVAMLLFVVIGIAVLARPTESPPNPFIDYADFLPGQFWSAGVAQAFRCNTDIAGGNAYCFLSPADGAFSDIGVTIAGDQITQTAFTLRENTLKVGDLASLWGRPDIQILGHATHLDWPAQGITAIAYSDDGQFNYWQPIIYVSFGA
jgi:hypothetical protein